MNKPANLTTNDQGFVSIMVTIIVMSILGLIVAGFMTIMTREQRQVQDRQLSTQAFYAAEAGVNDAIAYLRTPGSTSRPNCPTLPTDRPVPGYDNRLDGSTNISYSCVVIDKAPLSLSYDTNPDRSLIVPLRTTGGAIQDIIISWQDTGGATPTPSTTFINDPTHSHALPRRADPSIGTGLVRATVMPFRSGDNRDNLINKARSFFLYPNGDSSGTSTRAYSEDGAFIDGNCSTTAIRPRYCQSTIRDLSGTIGSVAYLRLKAIYQPVSIHVQVRDNAGRFLPLNDAQAIVDSTGKASDVLRRIQVNVPLVDSYDVPESALQSLETICKRMIVWNGGVASDAPTGDPLFPPAESAACDVPSTHTGVSATTGCGPPLCSDDPLTERKYYWDIYRINSTDPKGLGITGCFWEWGDGKTLTNTWCNPGDFIYHTYDPPPDIEPYPAACFAVGVAGRRLYNVRLTTHYSNGTSDTATVFSHEKPYCIDPP